MMDNNFAQFTQILAQAHMNNALSRSEWLALASMCNAYAQMTLTPMVAQPVAMSVAQFQAPTPTPVPVAPTQIDDIEHLTQVPCEGKFTLVANKRHVKFKDVNGNFLKGDGKGWLNNVLKARVKEAGATWDTEASAWAFADTRKCNAWCKAQTDITLDEVNAQIDKANVKARKAAEKARKAAEKAQK